MERQQRIAVVPGSFDPITKGHMDIIRRAKPLFDRVIVLVVINAVKNPCFSLQERVELIRATMRRLHLDNVRVAARDAMQVRDEFLGSMDAVLLDAPCSGLGVMDDKPDVKYRHTPESVAELCDTQRKLLDACCQYVRVGGTLVYSTCSMLKDENERQIARFLKDHPEFEIDALPDTVPSALRAHYGENGLQLLPCRDGVEGFFVARMKRRA